MAGYFRKVESRARGYSKRIRAVQFENLVGLKHLLAKTNGTGFCRGHILRIPLSLRPENPMIKYVMFADRDTPLPTSRRYLPISSCLPLNYQRVKAMRRLPTPSSFFRPRRDHSHVEYVNLYARGPLAHYLYRPSWAFCW